MEFGYVVERSIAPAAQHTEQPRFAMVACEIFRERDKSCSERSEYGACRLALVLQHLLDRRGEGVCVFDAIKLPRAARAKVDRPLTTTMCHGAHGLR